MRRCLTLLATALVLIGCASHGPLPTPPPPTTAAADTLDFPVRLARHVALPAPARDRARARADSVAAAWRAFESAARQAFDARYRRWYNREQPVPAGYLGDGLLRAVSVLREATALDPLFVEGWAALGRLSLEAGDPVGGLKSLECGLAAAGAAAGTQRAAGPGVILDLHRNRAWALRDLAAWEAGLSAADAGLALAPGDPELTLVRGLLLADAGRYDEALGAAVTMPALAYPRYDFTFEGFAKQTSAFANNWIRAEALLARGQVDDAYWILGDLDLYAYRGLLPHASRYWRDAALIAELHGDPKADLYYAVGVVTRRYDGFEILIPQNVAPQVLDVPDARMPVYLGMGGRWYVAGSPLSYVGVQLNRMATAVVESERLQSGGRALQMLDILERRHVRPDVCRALRGRVYFAGGDHGPAAAELEAARASFAAKGKVDPGTSLILGLVDMGAERWALAEEPLREAAAGWPDNALARRSLGVTLSKLGRFDEAEAVMTEAVALEPGELVGWYNRALLRLQQRRFADAAVDLERALALDPGNHEAARLMQMAIAGNRAEGGPPLPITADVVTADPPEDGMPDLIEEFAAALAVPDSLRVEAAGAEERFRRLETAVLTSPDPGGRRLLAQAYLERNLLGPLQALLAPAWGLDLGPQEELMLLWADRVLGETERAEEAVRELVHSGPGAGNPWMLALAADIMRTSVDPRGSERGGLTDFFALQLDARSTYANRVGSGRPRIVGYAASLYSQYASDPLFTDAQWGMIPTPFGGGGDGGK